MNQENLIITTNLWIVTIAVRVGLILYTPKCSKTLIQSLSDHPSFEFWKLYDYTNRGSQNIYNNDMFSSNIISINSVVM